MLVYCTYCSAEKNDSTIATPAIELYESERIAEVFEAARKEDKKFIILSGKYGILFPEEKISYYDHLLKMSEVEVHSDLIASQIKSKNITEIIFFMNSIEKDGNLKAYLDCISKACDKSMVSLKVVVADFKD